MFRCSTLWVSAAVVLLISPGSHRASAEAALALGISGDIAKDGYSLGITVNKDTEEKAREAALEWCRNHGSPATRSNCRVISVFRHQCAAEANDPEPGTPGVGWAIGADKETAEKMAMTGCLATAGRERQRFCAVATSLCDTRP